MPTFSVNIALQSTNYETPTSTQLGYKFETYAQIGDMPLSAATNTAVANISVPPGQYVVIIGSIYGLNGTNVQSQVYGAVSTTSATNDIDDVAYQQMYINVPSTTYMGGPIPHVVTVTGTSHVTYY